MKIAFMSTSLGQAGRGRNITNLSNGLVKHEGVNVEILLRKMDSPYIEKLDPAIKLTTAWSTSTILGVPCIANYFNLAKPDIFIAPSISNTLLALRARKFSFHKPKIIARIHNNYSSEFAKVNPVTRRRYLYRLKKFYPKCDGIIGVSNGVADDFATLSKIDRMKIHACPNPVISDQLQTLAQQDIAHSWLQDSEPPVLLGVGRLSIQKDFTTLVSAFAEVRKTLACKLIILGKGSQRGRLEKLCESLGISDDVDMVGYWENPYPWLKRASMFVLSSAWEGSPNVLIEALGVGTAVVSTDCPGGAREILKCGRYGPLVPVGNVKALATVILDTFRNMPDEACLLEAAERYRIERSSQSYLKVFHSIIG